MSMFVVPCAGELAVVWVSGGSRFSARWSELLAVTKALHDECGGSKKGCLAEARQRIQWEIEQCMGQA